MGPFLVFIISLVMKKPAVVITEFFTKDLLFIGYHFFYYKIHWRFLKNKPALCFKAKPHLIYN